MKRLVCLLAALLMLILTACGAKYTCYNCEKNVSQAYYDIDGDYMCKDCAKEYWIPLDYTSYAVK